MLVSLALDPTNAQDKLAGVDIHTRIKNRRTELGLSHQQVADRISKIEELKKPLAWQTVQQWETKTAPKRARMANVATALELSMEELLDLPARTANALQAREGTAPAYGKSWPFKVITPEQLSRLTPRQLASLETAMVSHLLQPTSPDWRTLALDQAAFLDRKNKDETFTTFIRAVDMKALTLGDQMPQTEDAA